MTCKDYEHAVKTLANSPFRTDGARMAMLECFLEFFASDSPAFDRERFTTAAKAAWAISDRSGIYLG